jgi:pyruvate/2-oxoglutarate dehydrogenase complex dihydrolipoamide dehydrogenase (E3) component
VVHVSCTEGSPEVGGSHVLLAVGRQPNTDDLALERAGLSADDHGYIEVDDQLRTSVEGIWALGDCNGRGGFTHTSYNDFEIVAANLLDGDPRRVSDRIPVYALYVDPPLAQVGMNERAVRESGKAALMGVRPMTRVGRAVEKGETRGFMKVLVDAATRRFWVRRFWASAEMRQFTVCSPPCTRASPPRCCSARFTSIRRWPS